MNKEDFVEEVLFEYCRPLSFRLSMGILQEKGKRSANNSPSAQLENKIADASELFNRLAVEDQKTVEFIVRHSIDVTLFELLVLFSDQPSGPIIEKNGRLELWYRNADGARRIITGEDNEMNEAYAVYHSSPDFPHWLIHGNSNSDDI